MYVPTSAEIKKYYDDLYEYFSSETDPQTLAQKDVEEYLINEYATNAHINYQNNQLKSNRLHLANGFLIITLVCTFVASIPYFMSSIESRKIYDVKIINFDEAQKSIEDAMSNPTIKLKPNIKQKPIPPKSIGRRDEQMPVRTPLPTRKK